MNLHLKTIFIVIINLVLFINLFSQTLDPLHLQDFDGFTNDQYAVYLAKDGWPVDSLNTGASAGYLNDDEKNLILAMNLIRYDPPKYSRMYIYPKLQYFSGTAFNFPGRTTLRTKEGLEAVRELYLELLKAESMPIFYPSRGMCRASRDHAIYMKNTGATSHQGQGGMSDRVSKYGQWVSGLAENLQWGTSNAHDAIVSLMVDDGIKSRGHRRNMMNPSYTKVGVAVEEHPRWRISYVINYAVDFIEK